MAWVDRLTKGVLGNLKPTQQLVLFFAVLSLIIDIITFNVFGSLSRVSYFVFAFSTTVIILSDRVDKYRFENDTLKELIAIGKKPLDLQFVGNDTDGIEEFIAQSRDIKNVSNTVFYRSGSEEMSYINVDVDKYERRIKQLLSEGCVWRDAVSLSQKNFIENFSKELNEKQRNNYFYRIVEFDGPMLQFMIVDFHSKDKMPIVLFGWVFSGGRKSNVYSSRGRDTVQYFQEYFEVLYAASTRPASATQLAG